MSLKERVGFYSPSSSNINHMKWLTFLSWHKKRQGQDQPKSKERILTNSIRADKTRLLIINLFDLSMNKP